MNKTYLDIIELSLSAYSDKQIKDYISSVKKDGLTEHGFPRLAANIGILISYGRKKELTDTFIEMMDICCESMPKVLAANDFSIREICCCLMLLEEKNILEKTIIIKWKEQIKTFDPATRYNDVAKSEDEYHINWAMFVAVSEFVRAEYLDLDSSVFIETQLATQMRNFDKNLMYKDPDNPILYDLAARVLMAFIIRFGYNGRFKQQIVECLDKTTEITLKMQSVNGELAFGGRSNQYLLNESLLVSYFEIEAVRYAKKGDLKMAGRLKYAARLAADSILYYLNQKPINR